MKPCRGTPRQPQNRDDHSTLALSAGTTAHAFSRRWAAVGNSASWLATMAASNNSAKIARSPEASPGGSAIGGSIGGIHAYLLSPGAMKAKTPGVLHIHRLATKDEADVRVSDRKNKVSGTALKSMEKLMKSPNGMAHPIEPRLISLLGVVSNHFGSRKIEIISGFRPFTPTQHNPHSNHMHGKAVDFRVVGVPNETLRDFCRTLKNVGCGYYPNSVFVHMDVRETSAFWIDYSGPGERAKYSRDPQGDLAAEREPAAPEDEAESGGDDPQGASSPGVPAPNWPALNLPSN